MRAVPIISLLACACILEFENATTLTVNRFSFHRIPENVVGDLLCMYGQCAKKQ